jgi:hypothetical protein
MKEKLSDVTLGTTPAEVTPIFSSGPRAPVNRRTEALSTAERRAILDWRQSSGLSWENAAQELEVSLNTLKKAVVTGERVSPTVARVLSMFASGQLVQLPQKAAGGR